VFIFEDMEDRLKFFKKILVDHDLQHTDQIEKAKKILLNEKWDFVFLDHDMEERFMDSKTTQNNGYQLAKWIVENKIKIEQIIIHSMNSVGAGNIREALRESYPTVNYVPFNVLRQSLRG